MSQNKTLAEVLKQGKRKLKENQVGEYDLDSQLFMMKAMGFSKVQLFIQDQEILKEQQEDFFWNCIEKRCQGMPTQYILEECEFMGLLFSVNKHVLIPRPDTEILVESILEFHKKHQFKTVLDVGTGSGCIPISLAYYGGIKGIGIDISQEALKVAEKNAVQNGLEQNLQWISGNLLESLPLKADFLFDVIVSNPPYIPTKEIYGLMREVRDYEPRLALDGGEDGLFFYRKIVAEAKNHLKKGGFLFFEIGYDQGYGVSEFMKEQGYHEIEIRKDLAGLDRVVLGRK